MKNTNIVNTESDSQFYTDLNQIENSLKYTDIVTNDHILIGIQNTIKMGYKIISTQSALDVNDIVIYKTDNCGNIPIIAKIKAITNDDTPENEERLIYTLKNVHNDCLFSTINRKRIVKWDNNLE